MEYILPIIFGIVQGLTEFIPVSSSGHLVILHEWFPSVGSGQNLAFDVSLHMGTLLALAAFFWKDCVRYVCAWFQSLPALPSVFHRTRMHESFPDDQRLAWLILLGIIPAGLAGVLFEDTIESRLRSPLIVIFMLVAVALAFIAAERRYKHQPHTDMASLTWKRSLFIGCMQVLALIPGTSRSGITILAGMLSHISREQAARFSFLLSIPLIAGAGLKKTIDLATMGFDLFQLPLFIAGALAAAVVGYGAIRFLLAFLNTRSLAAFAYYRIGLAVVLAIMFYV